MYKVGRYYNKSYTNYPCRVISSLWRVLKTHKICVTRRPWMETSAKLLALCISARWSLYFMLPLIITAGIDHC